MIVRRAGKHDRDELNRRLGTLRRRKMGKHFQWECDERTEEFTSTGKADSITAGERLDGICVIRTNLYREALSHREVGCSYQSLARVARISVAEDGAAESAPDFPLAGAARAGAPDAVHAGVLLGLPHAAAAGRRSGGAAGALAGVEAYGPHARGLEEM